MKNLIQMMLFIGVVFFNINVAYGEFGDRIELSDREVFIPAQLGDIKLYKDDDGFHVIKEDEIHDVQNYDCHGVLRNISTQQLRKFLGRDKPKVIIITPEELEQIDYDVIELSDDEQEAIFNKLFRSSGYIAVSQMSNGEYVLREKVRLLGGWGWNTLKRVAVACLIVGAGVVMLGLVCSGTGAAMGAAAGWFVGATNTGACIGTVIGAVGGAVGGSVLGGIGVYEDWDTLGYNSKDKNANDTPATRSNNPSDTPSSQQSNKRREEYDLPEVDVSAARRI